MNAALTSEKLHSSGQEILMMRRPNREPRGSLGRKAFARFLAACIVGLFLVFAVPAFAGTFVVFGPMTFDPNIGKPVPVTFTVLDPTTSYTMQVTNNGIN